MVKKFFILNALIIVSIIYVSCNRWYVLEEGGIRPVKEKFSTLTFRSDCNNRLIKTDAVYRLYERYLGDYDFASTKKEYYESISKIETNNEPVPYIRFYEGCKYNQFLVKKKNHNEIDKSDFNPNKGRIGIYSSEGDSLFKMEEFMNIEGLGKYVKGKATVKGDTLHIIMKVYNQISHKIYIKQEVPIDFLDWNAD